MLLSGDGKHDTHLKRPSQACGKDPQAFNRSPKMWSDQKEIEWYLPIPVVADQLRCHSREVFELAEKGIISFIRMPGNRMRISEDSVRQIASHVNSELC
jgi:excisionase family DNA binding protein